MLAIFFLQKAHKTFVGAGRREERKGSWYRKESWQKERHPPDCLIVPRPARWMIRSFSGLPDSQIQHRFSTGVRLMVMSHAFDVTVLEILKFKVDNP